MKKYLEIWADINDADYICRREEISAKELKKFMPLIKAIKDFKPYATKTKDWYENVHVHNFPYGECLRNDLGEETVYVHYKNVADAELIEEFIENYVPMSEYGIHTIKSIEIFEIHNLEKLL